MTEEDDKMVKDLIIACENILLTHAKSVKNAEAQNELIQQLIFNNNQMAEFAKKQNMANQLFTKRIYIAELFIFFILCWEVYKLMN